MGLAIDLIYKDSELQFDPTFKDIHDFIMSVYDRISNMVFNLERIEHRLYKDYPYTSKILNVN